MRRVFYQCPAALLDELWQSLIAKGFRVLPYMQDRQGEEVLQNLLGEVLWDRRLIENDHGALVFSDDIPISISVRRNPPKLPPRMPDGYFELHFGLVGRKKFFLSSSERLALRKVEETIIELNMRRI